MTIHVIGAGVGRTGTSSLKAALELLGFAPCYHMVEVFRHPTHARRWRAAAAGEPVDWPVLFGRYQATVDFPGCTFYKELMAAYPAAQVILTVRDPDAWYASTHATIYQVPASVPRWLRPLPWIRDLYAMTQEVVWHKHFGGRFHDRAHTLAQFAAWNAEVQAVVPPEKLLVYDVRQGWEPLCAFLGVPVPSVPFPHINDRTTTVRRIRLLRTLKHWGPAAAVFGFALLILWWQG